MNTLAAYRRDLDGARELIGPLEKASGADLASLGEHWADLAPSSLARKCSALRQFYGFLIDEGWRTDDPSPALPRPVTRRPLPRLLGHGDVEALFTTAEQEAASDRPEPLRLLALLEMLYGSGLRATELVSLPVSAVPRDAPLLTVVGKGGVSRMVPVSTRARHVLSRWMAVRAGRSGRDSRFLFPSRGGGISRGSACSSFCAIWRCGRGSTRPCLAPCAAPCLCHASAGRRRGSARFADMLGHADIATTRSTPMSTGRGWWRWSMRGILWAGSAAA
jgi:site-specific recombinase XerD